MTPPGTVADSVRLAWPTEADTLARLQRRSWSTAMVASPELAAVPLADMAAAWHALISRSPEARTRVLVAVGDGRVVGYAITCSSTDPDAGSDDGEIDQLLVDTPARRRGHGSRLLNAAVDTLRADGYRRARLWVAADDVEVRRFLGGGGWAADGATRVVGTDDGAVRLPQLRMHTDLGGA